MNFENMLNSLDLLLENDIAEEDKDFFYKILINLIHHKMFTEEPEHYIADCTNSINEVLNK